MNDYLDYFDTINIYVPVFDHDIDGGSDGPTATDEDMVAGPKAILTMTMIFDY